MSIVSSEELQERFYVTKLYGEESLHWPKSAICLVNCNVKEAASQATWKCITGTDTEFDDWKRFDNTVEESSKQHAEASMIEFLNTMLFNSVYTNVEIKIYINYSPCSDCANTIMDMKNNLITRGIIDHNIQIFFANFYGCHGYGPNNKSNRNGLASLLRNGVSLSVFSDTVWDDLLHSVLKVHPGRKLHHVIPGLRMSRHFREKIDQLCLDCLKEKSRSPNEEEHEQILAEVFAKNKGLRRIDYEQFVTNSSKKYIEKMQSLANNLQSLNLHV